MAKRGAPIVIPKQETRGVLLYLPIEVDDDLERVAAASKRTKSWIGAQALKSFLRKAIVK